MKYQKHEIVRTPQEVAENLAAAVREVVDSFTTPDGTFIHDDLTTVEYESLKSALRSYDEVTDGNAEVA